MPTCKASGCSYNGRGKDRARKKGLFRIPEPKNEKEKARAERWLHCMGIGQTIETFKFGKSAALCEDHFHPDCMKSNLLWEEFGYSKQKQLVEGAVPSIFKHCTFDIINMDGTKVSLENLSQGQLTRTIMLKDKNDTVEKLIAPKKKIKQRKNSETSTQGKKIIMSRKDGKIDDLKNMLMSFRIAELQTLLASCGRSRSGRKHELLGRAVSLLKTSEGSSLRERVKSRILELYHQRYPSSGGTMGSSDSGNMESMYSSYNQPYLPYSREKDEEPTYLNRPSHYKHIQHRSSGYSSVHHDSRSHLYEPQAIRPVGGVPVHPDVRFIPLPFYDIVDVLIKPTSLVQKTVTGYQELNLTCSLSPYQTQLITNSRSYNIKSVMEYAVQVQLRFCLAETSCIQEDLYPPRVKIIVNGKSCAVPGQPPPNAQNQEPRKPHRPVNLTQLCRLSPMHTTQIQIQWMPSDLGQRYAATVHLVQTVQTIALIKKLEDKPIRSSDHTIAFIKEKLRQDPDSEIALTSLKVSLCCPIARTKMKMPCRAKNCNHLQCFDGATFIMMNERKPSWLCPVCDQKAHYDQLFKDGLFFDIIEKTKDCDDIVFFEDGSWRPLSDVQDSSKPLSQVVNTPKAKAKAPLVDCKTPPPLSNNSPSASALDTPRPDTMPVLTKMDEKTEKVRKMSESFEKSNTTEDDDVEIITIDDSDSDDNEETLPPPLLSESAHRTVRYGGGGYPETNHHQSSSLPFSDPDLQGLDLYNLLPHEDRIAAAMYLDQAGILGQLTNASVQNTQSSPSSIIDISDE